MFTVDIPKLKKQEESRGRRLTSLPHDQEIFLFTYQAYLQLFDDNSCQTCVTGAKNLYKWCCGDEICTPFWVAISIGLITKENDKQFN